VATGVELIAVKVVVAVAAAKLPLAAWLAVNVTVPATVGVTWLPMIVARLFNTV
jgi:hypothetical protein